MIVVTTRLVLAGALVAGASLAAAVIGAAPQVASPQSVVVVELFTSEGCSSCPPADALLMELVGKQPVKGALIAGLSEHVTYWDQQGWKDPFSDAGFTARQSEYRAAMELPDIYTPQMIVDGVREFAGHDRAAAIAAIARAAATSKPAVQLSWAAGRPAPPESRAQPLSLDVRINQQPKSAGAPVFLAIVEDGLSSAVKRGENGGRTLTHAAVTRRLLQIGTADPNGAFQKAVPIDLKPSWNRPALRVIVFVQARRAGPIVAAGTIGLL